MTAPVAAVTVLEDRASITRRGTVTLEVGQQRIVIERVSPILVDKTLTATCGGGRVLDVRCERYVAPWRDDAGQSQPATLRAERAAIEAKRDAALARGRAAHAEALAIAELATASLSDLAVAATRGNVTQHADQQLAELDAAEAAARVRGVEAELVVEDLVAALDRLDERIARAEAEAGEQAARLIIDVLIESAGEVAITAAYIVPGARGDHITARN